jgi:electron transport complex protein RnfB
MEILIPALVLSGLGFVMGSLIFLVDKFFHVEEDSHIPELKELLPGYDCGACGHPGCKEMAVALLNKESVPSDCKPMTKEQEAVVKDYLADYFADK